MGSISSAMACRSRTDDESGVSPSDGGGVSKPEACSTKDASLLRPDIAGFADVAIPRDDFDGNRACFEGKEKLGT
jgi:hypothetical protein